MATDDDGQWHEDPQEPLEQQIAKIQKEIRDVKESIKVKNIAKQAATYITRRIDCEAEPLRVMVSKLEWNKLIKEYKLQPNQFNYRIEFVCAESFEYRVRDRFLKQITEWLKRHL